MASLPSVAEIIEADMVCDAIGSSGMYTLSILSVHRPGLREAREHQQTLVYTAAALETDLTKAGTTLPTSRIHAYLMQGRAHVALGHVAEGLHLSSRQPRRLTDTASSCGRCLRCAI